MKNRKPTQTGKTLLLWALIPILIFSLLYWGPILFASQEAIEAWKQATGGSTSKPEIIGWVTIQVAVICFGVFLIGCAYRWTANLIGRESA